MVALSSMPEDILLLLFKFFAVSDTLNVRQTCRRLRDISLLRIVWINFNQSLVLSCNLDSPTLEADVRRASRVASKWQSGHVHPASEFEFTATLSTAITDVRFVKKRWVLTVSSAIWSTLSIWDWAAKGAKCSEWSPHGAMFEGALSVNTDHDANACIAILTTNLDNERSVVLLSVDDAGKLSVLCTIPTNLRPMSLHGPLLALCDEGSGTTLYNTSTQETINLESEQVHFIDHAIDVVFSPSHVLVVRARSIHLFAYPSAKHVDSHSFGWVDGMSVAYNPHTNGFSVLVRHQSDNPWTADTSTLQLHTIPPAQGDLEGYQFPPVPAIEVCSPRGAMRCPKVVLGKYGTALWIRPHERSLVADESSVMLAEETLVAAVFPGALNAGKEVVSSWICSNAFNNWTAFDYDEDRGLMVIASSFGKVLFVEL
ncbi:hypothetical protein CYLTODRAFT_494450 [Cylindrobasidium torrendii FP15055 ss-10]|uniref:F-box domain-containing protein n=1 Tax=Cylindrobasidium torrendii FP15055 ss-10 TaxID=1314674 RepID=A0A0D7AWI9_9AGAR|nr:hypothetical protein CYLTODRAFT_494450 [Cylindrobasidium torrendii FP15055 ss-10]